MCIWHESRYKFIGYSHPQSQWGFRLHMIHIGRAGPTYPKYYHVTGPVSLALGITLESSVSV